MPAPRTHLHTYISNYIGSGFFWQHHQLAALLLEHSTSQRENIVLHDYSFDSDTAASDRLLTPDFHARRTVRCLRDRLGTRRWRALERTGGARRQSGPGGSGTTDVPRRLPLPFLAVRLP